MAEVLQASATESPAAESRRWIGRFVIAVILGEAIWSFVVSITSNLVLPAMARVLGSDGQSPLSLGKTDFSVPALFASVLELCLAGIVAVLLNAWTQKPERVRTRVVSRAPVAVVRSESPAPSLVPSIVAPGPVSTPTQSPEATIPSNAAAVSEIATSPAQPPSQQPVPSAKPKKAKKVYYNIVGEPIEDDE